MYFFLGISLLLAFLLIVNLLAALGSTVSWRIFATYTRGLPAFLRSQALFLLRTGPIAVSLILLFAFVLPAYLLHEPDESGEVVSVKLAILALVSCMAVIFATVRVVQGCLATRRLTAQWREQSVPMRIDAFELPVRRIQHEFPVVAVIGVFSPCVYLAEQVLESLSPEELLAVLTHELGHVHSRDNLKSLLLRVCRDLLLVPIGKNLDSAWARNAEASADEYVAGLGVEKGVELASALVKLVRLAPMRNCGLGLAASALFEAPADVTDRVRRLLSLSADRLANERSRRAHYRVVSRGLVAALAVLLVFHFADGRLLLTTHEAIEHFVWLVQ